MAKRKIDSIRIIDQPNYRISTIWQVSWEEHIAKLVDDAPNCIQFINLSTYCSSRVKFYFFWRCKSWYTDHITDASMHSCSASLFWTFSCQISWWRCQFSDAQITLAMRESVPFMPLCDFCFNHSSLYLLSLLFAFVLTSKTFLWNKNKLTLKILHLSIKDIISPYFQGKKSKYADLLTPPT